MGRKLRSLWRSDVSWPVFGHRRQHLTSLTSWLVDEFINVILVSLQVFSVDERINPALDHFWVRHEISRQLLHIVLQLIYG